MLQVLDHLARQVAEVDGWIRSRARESSEASLLMSVPGVGFYLGLLILAEIGSIERFPSARKLASYAGLVPTTRSSGGRTYHGRITKQGSSWLRWAMIQAVLHAVRSPGPVQRFYRRQVKRKGRSVARVAAARKLLTHNGSKPPGRARNLTWCEISPPAMNEPSRSNDRSWARKCP